jgi:hypothetical protein
MSEVSMLHPAGIVIVAAPFTNSFSYSLHRLNATSDVAINFGSLTFRSIFELRALG